MTQPELMGVANLLSNHILFRMVLSRPLKN